MNKDLTLTLESKIPNLGDTYQKLESYSSFYGHLERILFQILVKTPVIDSEFRKNLKKKFHS